MTPLPIDDLLPECLEKLAGRLPGGRGAAGVGQDDPAAAGDRRSRGGSRPRIPNVVVLQPRRIAARAAARRVADERGWTLGDRGRLSGPIRAPVSRTRRGSAS